MKKVYVVQVVSDNHEPVVGVYRDAKAACAGVEAHAERELKGLQCVVKRPSGILKFNDEFYLHAVVDGPDGPYQALFYVIHYYEVQS